MTNLIFYLSIAFMLNHELDAIRNHEWRLFAPLKPLSDETAYRVFTALHIPLFVLIFWFIANPSLTFAAIWDGFCIVHVGLHWLFRNNPDYEFKTWFSNLWIGGAGFFGFLHLMLLALT